MFMLCSRRSARKLECISAAMDRAMPRAATSVGQNLSLPVLSFRCSIMARLSHTTVSPSQRTGTLPDDGENSSEERSAGQECVSTCIYRWLQDNYKKKKT